jgi:hypothetical protein
MTRGKRPSAIDPTAGSCTLPILTESWLRAFALDQRTTPKI